MNIPTSSQVLSEHLTYLITTHGTTTTPPDGSANANNNVDEDTKAKDAASSCGLRVSELCSLYRRHYGYQIRPDNLGYGSIIALLSECYFVQ